MKVDVFQTHKHIPEGFLKAKNVIVIDVLRATSVITTALANGATKIMTASSIEEAFAKKEKMPKLLLGGERMAVKVKGFDFGNSPLEYTSEKIQNRTILLSTTNGTHAVEEAMGAKLILAASFLNLKAIVNYLDLLNEDFVLLCSGTNGNFSLDDGLCAGLIIHELRKRKAISTTDFGELLSLSFRKNYFSLAELVKPAFHLALLRSKGHQNDIDYCLNISSLDVIPVWKSDGFVRLN